MQNIGGPWSDCCRIHLAFVLSVDYYTRVDQERKAKMERKGEKNST